MTSPQPLAILAYPLPDENRSAIPDCIMSIEPTISAIVPARNEEANIAACVESLALQPEIGEIIVVDDQSGDRTAEIVKSLTLKHPQLRLVSAVDLPAGWVGKNHAVWLGAQETRYSWLLFTDADATQFPGAAAKALENASQNDVALVSYSPQQLMKTWYEKSLIPFVYCRLATYFDYEKIRDPKQPQVAAANGQFLLIRRAVYDQIGGHAAVAADVLEDVALARRVKAAGHRLWFGPGQGIVQTRMYRSFSAMWQGWKKNLYRLIGGGPRGVYHELDEILPWMPLLVLLIGIKIPLALFLGVVLLLFRQMGYGKALIRNQFGFSLILYYVPAVVLYSAVLWASYRSHAKGTIEWKGRHYSVSAPNRAE